jgi:uncharacterized protein YabN with tetrapyrrole methylase and pyrophosphatase domain
LLFSVAQLARHQGIDPEQSLRDANDKFERRFRAMEASARRDGRDLAEMTPDELEARWLEAKREVR